MTIATDENFENCGAFLKNKALSIKNGTYSK